MPLTDQDVQNIARLARLAVPEQQLGEMAQQLDRILNLFTDMQAIDTHHIEPMAHPQNAMQRLREDVVTEVDQRDHYQAIAPAVNAGLYLVPKVIE